MTDSANVQPRPLHFTVYGSPNIAASKTSRKNKVLAKLLQNGPNELPRVSPDDESAVVLKPSQPIPREIVIACLRFGYWRTAVALEGLSVMARMGYSSPWECPVSITVAHRVCVNQHSFATGADFPDNTNLLGRTENGLSGIVFLDDVLVVESKASREIVSHPKDCGVTVLILPQAPNEKLRSQAKWRFRSTKSANLRDLLAPFSHHKISVARLAALYYSFSDKAKLDRRWFLGQLDDSMLDTCDAIFTGLEEDSTSGHDAESSSGHDAESSSDLS